MKRLILALQVIGSLAFAGELPQTIYCRGLATPTNELDATKVFTQIELNSVEVGGEVYSRIQEFSLNTQKPESHFVLSSHIRRAGITATNEAITICFLDAADFPSNANVFLKLEYGKIQRQIQYLEESKEPPFHSKYKVLKLDCTTDVSKLAELKYHQAEDL